MCPACRQVIIWRAWCDEATGRELGCRFDTVKGGLVPGGSVMYDLYPVTLSAAQRYVTFSNELSRTMSAQRLSRSDRRSPVIVRTPSGYAEFSAAP